MDILRENGIEGIIRTLDSSLDSSFGASEINREYEIRLKPEEWSKIDYKLAIRILKNRGQTVDRDLLDSLKNKELTIWENLKNQIWGG